MRGCIHTWMTVVSVTTLAWAAGCASAPQPVSSMHSQEPAPQSASMRVGPAATSQSSQSLPLSELFRQAGGPAAGWLIGAAPQNIDTAHLDLARRANKNAERHPASPTDVTDAATADLNNDGFITLDELLAMKRAGLKNGQIVDRIRAANQAIAITGRQRQYLHDRGIDDQLLDSLANSPPPVRNPLAAAPSASTAPAY